MTTNMEPSVATNGGMRKSSTSAALTNPVASPAPTPTQRAVSVPSPLEIMPAARFAANWLTAPADMSKPPATSAAVKPRATNASRLPCFSTSERLFTDKKFGANKLKAAKTIAIPAIVPQRLSHEIPRSRGGRRPLSTGAATVFADCSSLWSAPVAIIIRRGTSSSLASCVETIAPLRMTAIRSQIPTSSSKSEDINMIAAPLRAKAPICL